MRQWRIVGFCLVATCATSAVTVAAASAAKPELINAKKEAVKGKIKGKSEGALKFETANGTVIECTSAEIISGETGAPEPKKEMRKVVILFKGCTESVFGGKCTSGNHAAGEIETNPLRTVIGYVVGSAQKKAGIEFEPESGEVIATFGCGIGGFNKIELKGELICQQGAGEFNKKTMGLKLNCEKGATKGAQKITEIEGGRHQPAKLESSVNKGVFEASNLQGKGKIEFEELVELFA
jgi:hypothetical protein